MATTNKKPSAKKIYNSFFDKFCKKGYVSSMMKNKLGNDIFEFQAESSVYAVEAKKYLIDNGIKYSTISVNVRTVYVKP